MVKILLISIIFGLLLSGVSFFKVERVNEPPKYTQEELERLYPPLKPGAQGFRFPQSLSVEFRYHYGFPFKYLASGVIIDSEGGGFTEPAILAPLEVYNQNGSRFNVIYFLLNVILYSLPFMLAGSFIKLVFHQRKNTTVVN